MENRINGNRKIGIMGGTFDPPHFGHFVIAQAGLEQLGLDKVIFIPNGKIAYKDTSDEAKSRHRYNMLRSVIESNPDFEISDMEINRGEITYTSDTLTLLKDGGYKNDELYFLVGADSLDYMDKWHCPDIVFSLCTVAVAERPGFDSRGTDAKIRELTENFGAKIEKISIPLIGISSTMLRQRIRDGGSIRYMTDDSVIEYIKRHKLYGGG